MQKKSDIRKVILARRHAIGLDERICCEAAIIERIRSMPPYGRAATVALYMPVRGEVSLLPLWRPEEKSFVFPKVAGDSLVFSSAASKEDFVPGAYGILEPISGRIADIGAVDIVFVPGLAFDRYGYRLGYGKGYYDRLIGNSPAPLFVGVCMDEFRIKRLPVDPWDAQVDYVVTQAGIYKEGEV